MTILVDSYSICLVTLFFLGNNYSTEIAIPQNERGGIATPFLLE
jgi:hypothetical protein